MNKDTGIIIGRFQVEELKGMHKDLLEYIHKKHQKVIVFLGVSPTLTTKRNPLDFGCREEMLLEAYPGMMVLPIHDHPSDIEWSKELDEKIKNSSPDSSVIVYGSRQVADRYHGPLEIKLIEQIIQATEADGPGEISGEEKKSKAFRSGVIFAASRQYPKVFATVDVAILDGDRVLLGRKPNQQKFRFLGGFTDPEDSSYEEAAQREVQEESGLQVDNIVYLGSAKIDDWRYRAEEDKIITHLFTARYTSGTPQATDDIAELKWYELKTLREDIFTEEHVPLFNILQKKLSF